MRNLKSYPWKGMVVTRMLVLCKSWTDRGLLIICWDSHKNRPRDKDLVQTVSLGGDPKKHGEKIEKWDRKWKCQKKKCISVCFPAFISQDCSLLRTCWEILKHHRWSHQRTGTLVIYLSPPSSLIDWALFWECECPVPWPDLHLWPEEDLRQRGPWIWGGKTTAHPGLSIQAAPDF